MALEHPLTALLEFATNEQVSKSVFKALGEGGKETLDRSRRAAGEGTDPSRSARRAISVDLALAHEERADRLRPPYGSPPFT
ncbi:hypothetical protein B0H14DRAFT_2947627 [Mycena olivaceomarginata]|nr:hypothetical protein B0H14DRAFT_2947627 [Mycena olivaceomarginata]